MTATRDQARGVETASELDTDVLLIDAAEVGRRVSISKSTLHKLVAVGATPKPVHLGSRALWRVEEIEEWVRDGFPPIERWERRRTLRFKPPVRPPSKNSSKG